METILDCVYITAKESWQLMETI